MQRISFKGVAHGPYEHVRVTADSLVDAQDLVMAVLGINESKATIVMWRLGSGKFPFSNYVCRDSGIDGVTCTKYLSVERAIELIRILDTSELIKSGCIEVLRGYFSHPGMFTVKDVCSTRFLRDAVKEISAICDLSDTPGVD